MRKSFFYFLSLALILLPSTASADKFTLTTFFPAPFGSYKSLVLSPQGALPTNSCQLGTLYANASDSSFPYYCGLNGALPEFTRVPGAWTLSGSSLYLTDTSSPENKKVGIDTESPIFKLTLANDGGIWADNITPASDGTNQISYSALPAGILNSALVWYPLKFAFRAGFSTSQLVDSDIGDYSMAMGMDNTAGSTGTTVWGGQNNSAGVQPPVGPTLILGYEVIAGGKNNSATLQYAQILGGEGNIVGTYARASGKNNNAQNYATIGGGENNDASSAGYNQTISGGLNNSTHTDGATVSGGKDNTNWGFYATISGGLQNFMPGHGVSSYATISGGQSNTASGKNSTIGGGKSNNANGDYSTISGGTTNTADGVRSTITGGSNNSCSTLNCAIAGGGSNTVSTAISSSILGGQSNTAKGINASILGGSDNTAWGKHSIAAGKNMNLGLTSDYDFIWGYADSLIPAVTATNVFLIYSGRMGIRDASPDALLEINGNGSFDDYLSLTNYTGTPGDRFIIKNNGYIGVNQSAPTNPLEFGNGAYVDAAGNFMPASSREYKENIADLSIDDAMKAFSKLEPVQYHYKNEPTHQYLGFIAEDVPDLVASQDRKGLAPMDIAAVLTKVVAHQQDILDQQKKETEKLLNDVKALKSKLKERSGQ